MTKRRDFLKTIMLTACAAGIRIPVSAQQQVSDFSKRLSPIGRALELEGYYVWCNSPILAPDGKVHVFFSRWPENKGMGGWINSCEIAHAVADTPESEFTVTGPVLSPRGAGYWDATTCHNPHIKNLDGKYCLFYMGNSNGKTDTKRIGLATAESLHGPWKRSDVPLLEAGPAGAWDDHCTTNPAVVKHPNGSFWLYYKSWNTSEYQNAAGPIRGNRKYGLAIAAQLEGPYKRHQPNPVIDFSTRGNNRQFEDAFVWIENNEFNMLARDMGIFNHDVGLHLRSADGITWGEPEIAYEKASVYVNEPPALPHLKRYGRFERPQLLIYNGKPQYLFTAAQGGRHMTASSFIFKINS